jgi:hypothetical protein
VVVYFFVFVSCFQLGSFRFRSLSCFHLCVSCFCCLLPLLLLLSLSPSRKTVSTLVPRFIVWGKRALGGIGSLVFLVLALFILFAASPLLPFSSCGFGFFPSLFFFFCAVLFLLCLARLS